MARGFESKDVEFQQAEAERTRSLAPAPGGDAGVRLAAQHTIALTLTHARTELAATVSPVRREALSRAIVALERQLTETGSA